MPYDESDDIARAYALLLERPDLSLQDFAENLGQSEDSARTMLSRLAAMSLLRDEDHDAGSFVPVSPVLAMHNIIAREQSALAERQEALRQSYATLSRIVQGYPAAGTERSSAEAVTEAINDLTTVRRRLEELALATRSEVLSFSPAARNPSATRAASRSLDLGVLSRGVRMRTVYLDTVAYDPDALRYAGELVAAGGEVRVVPELPMRLVIVDRATAIVPMNPLDSTEGCLIIRHHGTVTALIALFESYWHQGRPLSDGPGSGGDCSSTERAVLRLLAAGSKDEAVARQIGVSVRTVRRAIAELMTRAGASSRFELGVRAATRGWL